MYSSVFSFDSAIYNGFSLSELDDRVSLHPEQIQVLERIEQNRGLIFSAPTSVGKTFVIFEYIARFRPKNVVLVVHNGYRKVLPSFVPTYSHSGHYHGIVLRRCSCFGICHILKPLCGRFRWCTVLLCQSG